ncbi:MAG: DUF2892 domain-containing protein [Syntrophomonas sp.]|nr:DUF2892 domain-containing protein [Syntrophomonas sp.]
MNLSFNRNLGMVDRTIRIIVGIIMIYLGFFSTLMISSWVALGLGFLGAAMIIEGSLGY